MKLNPPASSSDVETAREIARRLHHHRRREDRPATTPAPMSRPTPPAPPPAPPPRVEEEPKPPLPFEPPPAIPTTEPEPAPAYGAPDLTPSEAPREAPSASPVPAERHFEIPAPAAPADDEEPVPGLAEPGPPSWDEEPTPPPPPDTADDVLDALVSVPPPDVDAVPAGAIAGSDVSVEVEDDGGDRAPAPPSAAPEAPLEEELFDTPAPPAWDDIAESCMRVAGAHGAMLVDPRGRVFAARGDWPEPGPDAIAGRLVAMMDRALRDAPTRSVSAPVAGMHLTAWRIPTSGGLITTALVADEPVRAELRHVVDTEIHRAAGS